MKQIILEMGFCRNDKKGFFFFCCIVYFFSCGKTKCPSLKRNSLFDNSHLNIKQNLQLSCTSQKLNLLSVLCVWEKIMRIYTYTWRSCSNDITAGIPSEKSESRFKINIKSIEIGDCHGHAALCHFSNCRVQIKNYSYWYNLHCHDRHLLGPEINQEKGEKRQGEFLLRNCHLFVKK